MKYVIFIFAILCLFTAKPNKSFANDLSHAVQQNYAEHNVDENYFELGYGVSIDNYPSLLDDDAVHFNDNIIINGLYQKYGFFIEAFSDSREPLNFGYNLLNYQNWSFDVIAGGKHGFPLDEKRFEGLDKRLLDFMFGGRLTGYFDQGIMQFYARRDVIGTHDGFMASILYGTSWQYRNWNFHSVVGIEHRSKKVNDYYFGVSEAEASRTDFNQYEGKANTIFTGEVGVTYPLSETWIFSAAYRFSQHSSVDSPLYLTNDRSASELSFYLSYVF